MYIYHSPHTESPRVTVVGELLENFLYVAVARCSEKDRFSRKIGRTIAIGRLKKEIYYEIFSDVPENLKSEAFYATAVYIANEVRENKKIVKN